MNARGHSPWGSKARSPGRYAWIGLLMLWAACVGPVAVSGASRGIVATGHPLASDAAVETLRRGGNAIDAAVGAALMLGVVDGHNSGIGGGCFLLIRLADGSVVAIDGREAAPAAAKRDMFLKNGEADTQLSQTGPLAIGVPGSLAAYDYAMRRYGKLSLKDHLETAASVAESGFHINRSYAQRLAATVADLRRFEATRVIFLTADGVPRKMGDLLQQLDLAKSYRAVAKEGVDWFYRGPFAEAMGSWMKSSGGVASVDDFRNYQIKLREPLRTTYRGHQIVGFPPPSSGGVHVGQILNILEHFDVERMGPGSADFVHVVTEAMKLAFADRAFWLGDPDFAAVPRRLVSEKYAKSLARKIDMRRASAVPRHNVPERSTEDLFNKHTTHFSTADADGNWVACTATINTSFGAKVVVPGTGVLMNNQMDDFSIRPGLANAFGLVGADANAVAPGKRPLSSMSPTIVMKNGQPVVSVGAAGGPTIISQTLLAIMNVIDFGMTLEQALAAPRFHHQWKPDELRVERAVPEKVREELRRRGHRVMVVEGLGATQAVGFDSHLGEFRGAPDPRGEGTARGL